MRPLTIAWRLAESCPHGPHRNHAPLTCTAAAMAGLIEPTVVAGLGLSHEESRANGPYNDSPFSAELSEDGLQRLLADAPDIRPGVLARVPAAIEYVNLRRQVWIDNSAIDDELNEALGVLTIAAGWAANPPPESVGQSE